MVFDMRVLLVIHPFRMDLRVFCPLQFFGISISSSVLVTQQKIICLSMQETRVPSLGWEDPMEEGIATHSSIFARRIPWTVEPDRLQSVELQRAGYDLAMKQQYVW